MIRPHDLLSSLLNDLRANRRSFLILVYVAVAVTLVEFVFLPFRLREWFPQGMRELAPGWWQGSIQAVPIDARGPWWGVLIPQAWWTGGTFLLWVVIPLAATRMAQIPLADLGLSIRKLRGSEWIYGVLFVLMLPAVVWASTQQGFLVTYPFLRQAHAPQWIWLLLILFWLMYAAQFFAVEFFFRGFVAFSLEKQFGMGAIAVATVPYCMIHFHKPLPEALGAIGAGLLLGWLALKTRSIWGGVVLHTSVALSMDLLALQRTSGFPERIFP